MKNVKKLIISLGLLIGCQQACAGFAGFGGPIKVSTYNDYDLPAAEAGSKSTTRHKVILTGVEEAHGQEGIKDIGPVFDNKLRSILFQLGVDLVSVEKSSKQKLISEIQKYEMMGTSEYHATQAASMAVRGYINSLTWKGSYNKMEDRLRPFDKPEFGLDGCDYTATVQGVLAFYKVNPLERSGQSIPIDESATWHVDSNTVDCKLTSTEIKKAYLDALDAAVSKIAPEIASQVPALGTVRAAIVDEKGKKFLINISIKPEDGAAPGTKVLFMGKKTIAGIENDIVVAEGKVVETDVGAMTFVKLKSDKDIDDIKKNMLVQLEYKCGLLCSMGNKIPGLPIPGMN